MSSSSATQAATPTARASTAWTALAHLLRPQGRKGELLAELLTDFPERFTANDPASPPRVFLAPPGFSGAPGEARAISVLGHWLPVGRNHGRVVLTFASIDSITLAESLAGLDVLVPSTERIELDDDSAYISDLMGCTVFDATEQDPARVVEIGTVTALEFPTSPDGARRLPDAAPLLTVLTANGEEILIPYVQSFVRTLNPAERRIEMILPPGLLDLNRT